MKWNVSSGIERWKGLMKQYQTVLLVLAAGILLMMLPSRESKEAEQTAAKEVQEQELFDMEILRSGCQKRCPRLRAQEKPRWYLP